ncbi:MAG: hypothetical protein JWN70_2623 [Planctomycetaceae bacterium]|nr:hypothetical protein [Planctomycetaceae bacterium]
MESVEQQVRQWVERIVIGLNLCPFAATPYKNGQVRITISEAATGETLLDDLRRELQLLKDSPVETLETTMIVVTRMLAEFDDYNQFLEDADILLQDEDWAVDYQIASFHPHYMFGGTRANDPGNLTNRSPWPILHILREASIDQALEEYPDPDSIPRRNVRLMKSLSRQERRAHFPWLE